MLKDFNNLYLSLTSLKSSVISLKDLNDNKIKQWNELFLNNINTFKSTDFLTSVLFSLKNNDVKIKNNFLKSYSLIVSLSRSALEKNTVDNKKILLVKNLTSSLNILGSSLILHNGSVIDGGDNFEKPNETDNLPRDIQPFEYAPIINDWIEMLLLIKDDWKDSFDNNYFDVKTMNELNIDIPYSLLNHQQFKNFLSKRDLILDDLVKRGRLKSKDALSRSL